MSTDAILTQIDDALEDWSVGPDAMRCNAPPGNRGLAFRAPMPRVDPAQLAALSVRINAVVQPFVEAMAKAARSMQAFVDSVPGLRAKLGLPPLHDEHHPAPLCIDGAAYHRKRRARVRRR